jgi:hypothetical protein
MNRPKEQTKSKIIEPHNIVNHFHKRTFLLACYTLPLGRLSTTSLRADSTVAGVRMASFVVWELSFVSSVSVSVSISGIDEWGIVTKTWVAAGVLYVVFVLSFHEQEKLSREERRSTLDPEVSAQD